MRLLVCLGYKKNNTERKKQKKNDDENKRRPRGKVQNKQYKLKQGRKVKQMAMLLIKIDYWN